MIAILDGDEDSDEGVLCIEVSVEVEVDGGADRVLINVFP